MLRYRMETQLEQGLCIKDHVLTKIDNKKIFICCYCDKIYEDVSCYGCNKKHRNNNCCGKCYLIAKLGKRFVDYSKIAKWLDIQCNLIFLVAIMT